MKSDNHGIGLVHVIVGWYVVGITSIFPTALQSETIVREVRRPLCLATAWTGACHDVLRVRLRQAKG